MKTFIDTLNRIRSECVDNNEKTCTRQISKYMKESTLKRNVYLVDWKASWDFNFKTESDLLKGLLGTICLEVHHIGSTAIKYIKAKPIIDILVVVQFLEDVDLKSSVFAQKGYEVKGENGISGRRYFQRDEHGERAYHIHVFEGGDRHITPYLLFRDSLRASPELASEYEKLKIELAERHKFDKQAYTHAKASFIARVINKV